MYYLLLDEVQKLGAFESVLNGFLRNSKLIQQLNNRNVKKNIAMCKQHGGVFCPFPIHSCRKKQ